MLTLTLAGLEDRHSSDEQRSPSQYGHELLIVVYFLLYLHSRLSPSTGHHTPYCYGTRQCSTSESFPTYRKDRRLRYGRSLFKFTSDCNVAVMPHSNIIDHKKVANLSAYCTRKKNGSITTAAVLTVQAMCLNFV